MIDHEKQYDDDDSLAVAYSERPLGHGLSLGQKK